MLKTTFIMERRGRLSMYDYQCMMVKVTNQLKSVSTVLTTIVVKINASETILKINPGYKQKHVVILITQPKQILKRTFSVSQDNCAFR